MARRTKDEIQNWEELPYRGREFVRAQVPRGDNKGQTYTVAKRVAERYEVKRFFASGGCGLLLAGRDMRTETEVLIKTTLRYDHLFYARGRDREGFRKALRRQRQQLQTERRILVQLKNRGCNAVPNPNDYVYDWNPVLEWHDLEDGQRWRYDEEAWLASEPYLVMEAIEGETLGDALEGELSGGMDEAWALNVLQQVTYVLSVLHRPMPVDGKQWQLVYQDLKPANILLGSHDYVTLVDLGGCRLLVNGQPALQGACTPGYCPPECDLTGYTLTPATDAYTVGATLFHMLTGQSPSAFWQSSLVGSGPKAVPHDRWNWALLQDRASRGTYNLVKRCLAHDPAERPADGAALHDEVCRLLG